MSGSFVDMWKSNWILMQTKKVNSGQTLGFDPVEVNSGQTLGFGPVEVNSGEI